MRHFSILLLLCVSLLIPSFVLAQDSSPISFDQTVSGEITSDHTQDRYTFEGAAGETIAISMEATQEGLDSWVELIGPNGEQFANDDRDGTLNALLPVILPADGVYTIVATRCCGANQGASTGPYELRVEQIDVTPVVTGEPTTVEVNASQPYVYLSFAGKPLSVLRLYAERLAGDATFEIAVRNPSGQPVNNAGQTEDGTVSLDPMFLNVDGNYILVVSRSLVFPGAQPSGDMVRLSLTLQEIEAEPIAVGDTRSGVLNDANPADHYLFSGSADDVLRLTGSQTAASQGYEILLYSQSGSVFTGASTGYQPEPDRFVLDPIQLAQTGEYLLIVHRRNPDGTTNLGMSEYTLTLSRSETPLLETGVEVEASLTAETWERVYRYHGAAEQAVRITLSSVSEGYAPGLNVQGPPMPDATGPEGGAMSFYLNFAGNLAGRFTYEVTLPANGVYLFRVNNATFSQTGTMEGEFSLLVEAVD